MVLIIVSILTSIMTFMMMYLMGSKKREAWLVSLLNQPLWFTIIVMTEAWGLVPLSVGMTILALRGWINWGKH